MEKRLLSTKYKKLFQAMYDYHHNEIVKSRLSFHGWHYVSFILKKAEKFAKELGADTEKTLISALTYGLFTRTSPSLTPTDVRGQVIKIIVDSGYDMALAEEIIMMNERIQLPGRLSRELTNEEKALSDAVCLYRILPVTPVLFSSKYMEQADIMLEELAHRILNEQFGALKTDRLFYTKSAKKEYTKWAETNIRLWQNIEEAMLDPDIRGLVDESISYRSLLGEYKIAIGILIVNPKLEVLVVQRDKSRENAPGSWELVYGRMHQGEEPIDALRREAMEEVGLEVTPGHVLGLKHFYRTKNDLEHVALIYLANAKSSKVNLVDGENSNYKWIPLEKAEGYVAEYDRFLVREACKILKR